MSDTHLKIWTNVALAAPILDMLQTAIAPHELVVAGDAQPSVLVGAKADPEAQNADIAFGQPDPEDVLRSTRLKWVHLTSAGYTRYDRDDIRAALSGRSAVITNSSSVYDEPCAEHLLAMMLGFARQLPQAVVDQSQHRWDQMPLRARSQLLVGSSVVIIGFGAIGKRVVELLEPLKMNVTAVRRSPRGNESIRVLPTAQVDELLATADHVINILPAAADTRHFFDVARIARIKRGAFFYNIGRGDTVDQTALRSALESGHLTAAYLDVTTPEPLPPGDPLWTAPNCYITPHTAGGHIGEFERLVNHFIENLKKFAMDAPLRDRILNQ